jgi:hypothetical protein
MAIYSSCRSLAALEVLAAEILVEVEAGALS